MNQSERAMKNHRWLKNKDTPCRVILFYIILAAKLAAYPDHAIETQPAAVFLLYLSFRFCTSACL